MKAPVSRCRICRSSTQPLFRKKILNKYNIAYFRCPKCEYIQTETPFWLDKSYSQAITSLDIGLISRNIYYADFLENILYHHFDIHGLFLDYAGGYGVLTRIMRDKGFNYFHQDKFCHNLFAQYFSSADIPQKHPQFELISAFEFLEHSAEPLKELQQIFSHTNSFLFTTEIIPQNNIDNWWYLGLEHGQHISFYSIKTLKYLAKTFGKNFYTNGRSLHLLTDKNLNIDLDPKGDFKHKLQSIKAILSPPVKLTCRTPADFEFIRQKIHQHEK